MSKKGKRIHIHNSGGLSWWSFQFITPLFLFFLMLVDNRLSEFLSTVSHGIIVPQVHLFLIVLMFAVVKHRLSFLLGMCLILGALFDSYYLGVLGAVAAIFPMLTLLLYEIRRVTLASRWAEIFTIVITTFVFEVSLAAILALAGLGSVNLLPFVAQQLAPTLIINMLLTALLAGGLTRFYQVEADEK